VGKREGGFSNPPFFRSAGEFRFRSGRRGFGLIDQSHDTANSEDIARGISAHSDMRPLSRLDEGSNPRGAFRGWHGGSHARAQEVGSRVCHHREHLHGFRILRVEVGNQTLNSLL